MDVISKDNLCLHSDVAAYLDGELDSEACAIFEQHVKECRPCAAQLAEQRRLLCVLDVALGSTREKFALPENFAQVVTACAQSDMSGVRHWSEHGRALALCAVLAVLAFALIGIGTLNEALAPVESVARTLISLLWMIGHALVDGSAGVAVILRSVGGRLIDEPNLFGLLTWVLLTGAVVLLLRLIGRYHRARIPD